jgi:hypothetical protein
MDAAGRAVELAPAVVADDDGVGPGLHGELTTTMGTTQAHLVEKERFGLTFQDATLERLVSAGAFRPEGHHIRIGDSGESSRLGCRLTTRGALRSKGPQPAMT